MTKSATLERLPVPPREVKTRRIEFDYPSDELRKYYADGDVVMSHVVSVLSSLFPEGEDFFVRSVRNYRDKITDPELKKQVGGFIGQEAIHGREHRTFNERLSSEFGYPTRFIDRCVKYGFRGLAGHVLPKFDQLAVTAALEHYTATLAEVLMGSEAARSRLDPPVRNLLLWHALEESEHKSVAFDVYQHVCGQDLRRRTTMRFVTIGFLLAVISGTVLSLALDKNTYLHPIRLVRSLRKLPSSPWLQHDVAARINDYNRKDFHPEDHDATELLEQLRGELFGDSGTLADKLKSRTAS